jgi:hypothetical protein
LLHGFFCGVKADLVPRDYNLASHLAYDPGVTDRLIGQALASICAEKGLSVDEYHASFAQPWRPELNWNTPAGQLLDRLGRCFAAQPKLGDCGVWFLPGVIAFRYPELIAD